MKTPTTMNHFGEVFSIDFMRRPGGQHHEEGEQGVGVVEPEHQHGDGGQREDGAGEEAGLRRRSSS